MFKQKLGKQAETDACRYLEHMGLRLLQKNYTSPFGEIDLIMNDRDDIVFVEVRSRSRLDYGSAKESITRWKMMKLIRTAKYFLQQHNWLYTVNSRFDVIAIDYERATQLEWIKNAFFLET